MPKDVRSAIVAQARWCVANKARFEYAEVRPMPYTTKAPIRNDCSATVTLCYYLAGAPDPNRQHYNGEGYTGTLITYGHEITQASVVPGDVVMYGPGTGVHCAVIVEGGLDPLTVSHGSSSEPAYVRVSAGNPTPNYPPRFYRYNTASRFPAVKRIVRKVAPIVTHPVHVVWRKFMPSKLPPQAHPPGAAG